MATTDIYHIAGDLKGRRAVAFLGGAVDDAVQIDAFTAARVAAADTTGTFTAWINVPDNTGTYCILSCGEDATVEYIQISVEAGTIFVSCKDNTTLQYDINTAAGTIKPHRWYHVALVQDGTLSTPKIYINGVDMAITVTDETDNATWFADNDGMDAGSIGAAEITGDTNLTLEYKGGISDVKYWTVALTADQVKQDMDGQNPADITGTTANLTDHWDFDGDYVNNITAGNNGTAAGDIILTPYYSEFTSRLRYTTGVPVVADKLQCFGDSGVGHAVVIQAA